MAAPKGNKFWKLRSKHGRDKLFATPELLWEAACEYFEWCDKNPWKRNEMIKAGPKGGCVIPISTERPYSLRGLCCYLGASHSFWGTFRGYKYENFIDVIARIEQIIETQQFEGAAVGTFNAGLIARNLGLNETPESEIPTKIVFEIQREVMTQNDRGEDHT